MKPFHMPIRVVFYRENDRMYAHCLEFDLLGDGDDHAQAMDDLWNAIATQVHATDVYNNPANLFTSAPPEIVQKFAQGDAVRFTREFAVRQIDNLKIEGVEGREFTPEPVPAA